MVVHQSASAGLSRTRSNRKPPALLILNLNLRLNPNLSPSRRVPRQRAHAPPPPQPELLQPHPRNRNQNPSTASSRQLQKAKDGLRRSSRPSAPPPGPRHRRQRLTLMISKMTLKMIMGPTMRYSHKSTSVRLQIKSLLPRNRVEPFRNVRRLHGRRVNRPNDSLCPPPQMVAQTNNPRPSLHPHSRRYSPLGTAIWTCWLRRTGRSQAKGLRRTTVVGRCI